MIEKCCVNLILLFILMGYSTVDCSDRLYEKKLEVNLLDSPSYVTCEPNSDPMYERESVLKKIHQILRKSSPGYRENSVSGFFVYDLNNPVNNSRSMQHPFFREGCVDFINNHIYHISPIKLGKSISSIIVLDNGKIRTFDSLNCASGKHSLEDVLDYMSEKLKNDKDKESILTRIKHYRRYGVYLSTDSPQYFRCDPGESLPNEDNLYSRIGILRKFGDLIENQKLKNLKRNYLAYSFEESRVAGFFIYDLTDPSNRQTSLLERVEFKNNHIYHFADIDLPFSFSNIVILEDGELKIFKAINCKGKGDSLEEIIAYLNKKLKNDKNKDEIIERVKNYREYGVYASFNGLSEPQCEEVVRTEK
jgi:hypothetical protein